MTIPILICDDSSFARQQMARALPENWDINISFAENGKEAIAAIKEGKGDILFLDLNMPVLDGYGTLEIIAREDLPTLAIVVSSDTQPEAHKRVKALGALDLIKKPTAKEKIKKLLLNYGILRAEDLIAAELLKELPDEEVSDRLRVSQDKLLQLCWYQEIANVAMGRAGDLLAQILNVAVKLPIPKANILASSELHMMLKATEQQDSVSAVCQGYTGSGISGEALILFYDSSFNDLARLMSYEGEINDTAEREMLIDLSNILIGAFLKGISDQLDLSFSQSHPELLGLHSNVSDIINSDIRDWQEILAIEINYIIEDHNIQCDLIILITQNSLQPLNNKIIYLLDEKIT